MSGRIASFILLAICIIVAALLLFHKIGPITGSLTFAVSLVGLGIISKGFNKRSI